MDITFYDSEGEPVAYSDDGVHIFLFSGEPVAYLVNESVYSFSGNHLGFFSNGWIRDHDGDAVFFSENSIGGLMKPLKKLKPLKSLKELIPLKGLRELRPLKPLDSFLWSSLSVEELFDL
jgi:hypothetical protein